jgi:hypothetical protein
MVLPGYALIAQGLQVHAAAWPGGTYTRQEVLSRAFAMQSAAYVVMSGGLMREQDMLPDIRNDHDHRRQDVNWSRLATAIPASWAGRRVLAGPVSNERTILTATGNTGTVMFQKMVADHRPLHPARRVRAADRRRSARRIWRAAAGVQTVHGAIRDGAIGTMRELAGAPTTCTFSSKQLGEDA